MISMHVSYKHGSCLQQDLVYFLFGPKMIEKLAISALCTVKQHTTISVKQVYSTCTPVQSWSHRRRPQKQDLGLL